MTANPLPPWLLAVICYVALIGLTAAIEGVLLAALRLASRLTGFLYALPTQLVTAVIAPVGVVAAVAGGFLSVFSEINTTTGVTTDSAFRAVAGPVAWTALGVIVVIRALPLLLMNLRSPLKALACAAVSTAVLIVLFVFAGIRGIERLG